MKRWTGLLLLAGCPWVGPAEHRANQDLLGPADTDADTDADSDSDTDTDADTDTGPTGPDCLDDAYEAFNSTLLPYDVPALPAALDGVLCPEDAPPGLNHPADFYRVELGATDVLQVTLAGGPMTNCGGHDLVISVDYDGQTVAAAPSNETGCPLFTAGWGSGDYTVTLSAPDATTLIQDYQLRLDRLVCRDADDDTFLAADCGGPDCDDTQAAARPGGIEVPGDGIDQDCDGGDDLQSICNPVTTVATWETGALPCGDLEVGAVWDGWSVPDVSPGSQISVVVDSDADPADLVALLIDPNGTSHYGLEEDRSQLDDERSCSIPPYACPAECLQTATLATGGVDGAARIWVAQRPGAACVEGATYRLWVHVDGVQRSDLTPVPDGDDAVLDWP